MTNKHTILTKNGYKSTWETKEGHCVFEITIGRGKSYKLNGHLHRVGGPALEYANGTKWWYRNGQRHREDGPAIIWMDGDKHWYINDKLHREDGPAIIQAGGNAFGCMRWYLHGHHYDNKHDWEKALDELRRLNE